jgi:3-hydroxyisobutyrate dehydrogenase-like beta-hydroxyacid dehydrogenase
VSAIGFVGLGLMGTPMASRLSVAGHRVAVTSRRHDPANAALAAGAEWVDRPAELAGCDAVITMLPAAVDVDQVLFGAGGLFDGDPVHALVVDMSTIGPAAASRLAAETVARGGRFADAPVSGGPPAAAAGTLAIMVGAGHSDYAQLEPVLSELGRPQRVGSVGSGQTAKLANQALIAGIMGGIADAFSLASSRGLSAADLHGAVSRGFGGSPLLDFVSSRLAEHDDAPGFKIAHMLKDLDLVAEAAAGSGADTRVAALVGKLFRELGDEALPLGTQRLASSRITTTLDNGEHR